MTTKKLTLITIATSPLLLSWPVVISYVLYLGFSRNEWLDDLFFHWEGISLMLVVPWIIATSLVGAEWAMRDYKGACRK